MASVPQLRSWPVDGFEDIRVYCVYSADAIRTVRVLHGRRDLERILRQEDLAID